VGALYSNTSISKKVQEEDSKSKQQPVKEASGSKKAYLNIEG